MNVPTKRNSRTGGQPSPLTDTVPLSLDLAQEFRDESRLVMVEARRQQSLMHAVIPALALLAVGAIMVWEIQNSHPSPSTQRYCDPLADGQGCVLQVGFGSGGPETRSFLRNGYRVLGVEANKQLLGAATTKYAEQVFQGKLFLLGVGIHKERDRSLPFYINANPDWSSFDYRWGCRDEQGQAGQAVDKCSMEKVWTKTCLDLLQHYGSPTYLRVSLEGENWSCLESLRGRAVHDMPQYISVGSSETNFLDLLSDLGYTKFKMVDMPHEMQRTTDAFMAKGSVVETGFGESARHMRTSQVWRNKAEIMAEQPSRPLRDPNTNESLWYSLHAAV